MDRRTPPLSTSEDTENTTADSSGQDTADKMEWEDLPTDKEPASGESSEPSSGFASGGPDIVTTEAISEKSPGETLSSDETKLAGTVQQLTPPKASPPAKEKSPGKSKIKTMFKKIFSPTKKEKETETQSGTSTSPPNRPSTLEVSSSKPSRIARILGVLSPKGKGEAASAAATSKTSKPTSSSRPTAASKVGKARYTLPSEPSCGLPTEISELSATSISDLVFEDEAVDLGPREGDPESEDKQSKIPEGERVSPQKRMLGQAHVLKGSVETDEPTSDSSKQETDDGTSEATSPKLPSSSAVFPTGKFAESVPSQLESPDEDDNVLLSPSKRRKQ